jgi:hypothetical protein
MGTRISTPESPGIGESFFSPPKGLLQKSLALAAWLVRHSNQQNLRVFGA